MKIELINLKENAQEKVKIGDLGRFKEDETDLDKYNPKNRLNDLNLFDWIRHTNSFHFITKRVLMDHYKLYHPATFEEELAFYYIEFFSKKNQVIFDPFLGSGTTSIAANLLNRKSIGIEINKSFIKLIVKRFKINELDFNRHFIFNGDCSSLLKSGIISSFLKKNNEKIAFTITSPPYYNILKYYNNVKNKRDGKATNYGEDERNLENIDDYNIFLDELTEIFKEIYHIMKNKSYLLINVRNFYKREKFKDGKFGQKIVFFAWDLVNKLNKTKWIPCAEQIWAYPNKKLFPFGSPYIYLANMTHSYNLIFYKNINKK